MKIVLKNSGGPSPGVTVEGDRQALIDLAEALRAGAERIPPGEHRTVVIPSLSSCGSGVEWIEFHVVPEIEPLVSEVTRPRRWVLPAILASFVVVAAILGLAAKGLWSLFR